jgi:ABC-type multidrug transport system fused ATPase/permease subunit
MDQTVKFSDVLSGSLTRVYRAGGLALVFVFVGVVLMLVGNTANSAAATWVGAALVIGILSLFIWASVKGPIRAQRAIRDSREAIDAIQSIAIELTRAISLLQALVFRYEEQVRPIVEAVTGLVQRIPPLRERVGAERLANVNQLTKAVVQTSARAEELITEIERSLVRGDVKRLVGYGKDLNELTQVLREALAA